MWADSAGFVRSEHGRGHRVEDAPSCRAAAISPRRRPTMTATETWRIRHAKLRPLAPFGPGTDRNDECGSVMAQQAPPATTVTALLKQMLADVPGREVMMITLDIPPGG